MIAPNAQQGQQTQVSVVKKSLMGDRTFHLIPEGKRNISEPKRKVS